MMLSKSDSMFVHCILYTLDCCQDPGLLGITELLPNVLGQQLVGFEDV